MAESATATKKTKKKHSKRADDAKGGAVFVVTGANGFVAQHVVAQLLEAGHTVRGTVRDAKSAKNEFLKELPGAAERLTLVSADLSTADAFDEVVQGADYALHIASPFVLDYQDAQKELIEPAIAGTLSLLKSVAKCGESVARVVVTSSVAAVLDAPDHGRVFTDADWNTTFRSGAYYESKAKAERAAWSFAKEHELDLVTINPFMVIGPTFNDVHNGSTDMLESMVTGKTPALADFSWGFVDVRDVAKAHINAALFPEANGRYLLSAGVLNVRQLADLLRRKFPQFAAKIPTRDLSGKLGSFLVKMGSHFEKNKGVASFMNAQVGHGELKLDTSKSVNELKIEYKSVEDAIVDSLNNSIRWKHV